MLLKAAVNFAVRYLFIPKAKRKNDFVAISADLHGGIETVIKFTTKYYLKLVAAIAVRL